MKLACSNIAWSKNEEDRIYPILRKYSVKGIELAPSVQWPNLEQATISSVTEYFQKIQSEGFEIPSIQAIFYGTDFSSIFDKNTWPDINKHLRKIALIASSVKAEVVIFGAPKMRFSQTFKFKESSNYLLPFFRNLADLFGAHGTCLCIEPCCEYLGSNFITNSIEAENFVAMVDHPSLGIHIDSAALYFANENINEVAVRLNKKIRHFHISEPNLGDFTKPSIPHLFNIETLLNSGYSGWFSIEMRNSELEFESRGPWNLIRNF